ncbi:MAG: Uma2 family endonuclease [Thermacetogeniaceae bacterium]|jgi:Uma2 family endonuclease
MSMPNEKRKHTYGDYLTWPEDERWEIIDGVPYMMTAPSWQHQGISMELSLQFGNYLRDKPCRVFAAPFDLCVPEFDESDEDISNLVAQPDLVVVCDEGKLRKSGYFGVPTLVIEIAAPSTSKKDRLLKFNKYEKAGVKEYWIVEPDGKIVSVFTLQENKRYGRPEVYSDQDKIKVSVFPDLEIDLGTVFARI